MGPCAVHAQRLTLMAVNEIGDNFRQMARGSLHANSKLLVKTAHTTA